MRRVAACVALSLLVAGCANVSQSALHPQGDSAKSIFHLTWIMTAGAAIVLSIVLAAIVVAIRKTGGAGAWLASERAIWVLGIGMPIAVLTVLLVYGLLATRALTAPPLAAPFRIDVVGEQWWWRVTYGEGTNRIHGANEIRVPVGRPVEFVLTSADVIHSFWIPSLAGKMDMIPGRETRLRLTALRPGRYRGQCAEYCGGPHALMAFPVVAMAAADFDAWIARQSSPVESGTEVRGKALFVASGCGSCHAVRGVTSGSLGPDLSNFGERGGVGVDTYASTLENVVRFIREGQHIKPRNPMPEFRILSVDDADLIARYLRGLK